MKFKNTGQKNKQPPIHMEKKKIKKIQISRKNYKDNIDSKTKVENHKIIFLLTEMSAYDLSFSAVYQRIRSFCGGKSISQEQGYFASRKIGLGTRFFSKQIVRRQIWLNVCLQIHIRELKCFLFIYTIRHCSSSH